MSGRKSDIYISIVFIVFYLMLILSKGIMKYSLKKGMICSMVCIELLCIDISFLQSHGKWDDETVSEIVVILMKKKFRYSLLRCLKI